LTNAHQLICGAAFCCLLLTARAGAQPGDAAAIAQARKDYAEAMKGHDIGLQNAMRAELAAQLAMSRQRAPRKHSRPAPRRNSRHAPGE